MVELVRLSVLDTYGVQWSRLTFARDIMQNFFDAHGDFERLRLTLDRAAGTIEVWGPHTFDLTLLFYIGATTKHDETTVGGFGEGFKICALVGVRDFGLRMTAGSGARSFEVVFDAVPLGKELCYRWLPLREEGEGAWVRLEGCDAELFDAFAATPNLFRHARHPDLQHPIAVSEDGSAGLYQVAEGQPGAVFYRRQHRGIFRWDAWSGYQRAHLCHDGVIAELEGDRDRRDLPVLPVARAVGAALAPDALFKAIVYFKRYWEWGRAEILGGLLEAAVQRALTWPEAAWFAAGQPDFWLASGGAGAESQDLLAKRQGHKVAMTTFGKVGMRRTTGHYVADLESRPATPLEAARAQVVADLYGQLVAPPGHQKRLEVFDDPDGRAAIQGQHFPDRILMNAGQLQGPFWPAATTLLHEHAHEVGGDADEKFWQRLEVLLHGVLRAPEKVVAARTRFESLTDESLEVEAQAKKAAERAEAEQKAAQKAAQTAAEPDPGEGLDPRAVELWNAAHRLGHWGWPDYDAKAIHVLRVFGPPGWVALIDHIAAVRTRAAARGLDLIVRYEPICTRGQARAMSLRGLPTWRIQGVDLPPDEAPERPGGLEMQTWEGRGLVPIDRLVDAIAQTPAFPGHRRYEALLPYRPPLVPPPPTPEPTVEERLRAAAKERWPVEPYSEGPGPILQTARYVVGQHALRQVLAEAPTSFDAAWAELCRRADAAFAIGHALRLADTTYERFDLLEVASMAAAEGMAMRLAIEGGDAEGGFKRVRGLYDEALASGLDHRFKMSIFVRVFDFERREAEGLDLGRVLDTFRAELARLHEAERASWITGAWIRPDPYWSRAYPEPDPDAVLKARQATQKRLRAEHLQWQALVEAWDAAVAEGLDDRALQARMLAVSPRLLGAEEAE